jgi:hypothetical protein
MVLKYMTVQQMKEVSRSWVEPGEVRVLLESFTQTKGLLGDLERVHNGLLEYVPVPTSTKKIEEIRETEQSTDDEYDDLLRGNYYTLTAQSNYTRDKTLSAGLITVRNTLIPNGLGGTQQTLREESGAALFLESKLNDEAIKGLLKAIPVGDGVTLFDKFRRQAEVGKKLGPLEDQKEAALKEAANEHQGPSDAAVRRSHLEWITVVRTLERNLQLARLSEEAIEKILGSLRKTAEIAQQRRDAALKSLQSIGKDEKTQD